MRLLCETNFLLYCVFYDFTSFAKKFHDPFLSIRKGIRHLVGLWSSLLLLLNSDAQPQIIENEKFLDESILLKNFISFAIGSSAFKSDVFRQAAPRRSFRPILCLSLTS